MPKLAPSLALACILASSSAANDRPNFLFIMADDVGCDALGCYGGESYKTPHLDALAGGGMRFTHAFSMPVCHPTRVCLLTGKYPFRLGHPRWGSFPKTAEKQSFAHALKRAGYATAVAGKWQLTMLKDDLDHPHRLGFDEYCLFGWHEGPRYFQPHLWQNGKLRKDVADRYGPDVYCDFLIDFMAQHKDQPFLAYYSMALCHDVTDDLKEPVPLGPNGRYENYQEMVESMDVRVGRLSAALERLKLREKTLVIYTTDNGTPGSYIATAVNGKLVRKKFTTKRNGKDVRGGKGKLTDAGTNVPLIANWPGVIRPGQVVNDLVDFSDFHPTLTDMAKAKAEVAKLDGHSFAPRLRGTPRPRQWAYAEQGNKYFVRDQRWKLYQDGRFYHVAADTLEMHPLKPAKQSPAGEAKQRLEGAMEKMRPRK